jgi:hypothetical protein
MIDRVHAVRQKGDLRVSIFSAGLLVGAPGMAGQTVMNILSDSSFAALVLEAVPQRVKVLILGGI